MAAVVDRLVRYPVKGLSPEPMQRVLLEPGMAFPGDRHFALAKASTSFDPAAPEALNKRHFLQLSQHERLARLVTRYDEGTDVLTVRGDGEEVEAPLGTAEGRAAVEGFFERWASDEAGGRPRLVSAPRHRFTDAGPAGAAFMEAVSLVNLASVAALGERLGRKLDPLRFRANVYLDGLEPWAERAWVGVELRLGGVRAQVLAETPRCGAIDVDPATAERNAAALVPRMQRELGHKACGVYVTVLSGGEIAVGHEVRPAPAGPADRGQGS